jgi:hypothetical protein
LNKLKEKDTADQLVATIAVLELLRNEDVRAEPVGKLADTFARTQNQISEALAPRLTLVRDKVVSFVVMSVEGHLKEDLTKSKQFLQDLAKQPLCQVEYGGKAKLEKHTSLFLDLVDKILAVREKHEKLQSLSAPAVLCTPSQAQDSVSELDAATVGLQGVMRSIDELTPNGDFSHNAQAMISMTGVVRLELKGHTALLSRMAEQAS